jgi:hypothetical protein
MSKKHYEALAQEIRLIRDMASRQAAFEAVATVCECYNPRFDRRVFKVACNA